ncbi:MAG TPA: histidine phosphatase family protein [Thermotoga sp.]|jgi:probable phosphoglycerate mutase|uniref:Phosphoglycerate mutase n=1 Tax=Thermotoga petrophila (strain ATCC BAA-488 / DSM 13995 / JCM 10881 / RKU-1) TaxID=390874 RepID=A5IMJ9_THEP1|nr:MULTISPECIES: histidine phosphatase family protein [Thermotoga]ABQ47422.1 Phosphoglycerate mutase [Thermotoga petrophila RKU-1]ACB09799.1 phosphoglycerate mutase [Thermotoga sp. RQ2]MBZ4660864.1 phosphoglycerate mutase [Thermotoga sp.]HBF69420.1 histidine phosphatase family protein [Thermotoga sp.]
MKLYLIRHGETIWNEKGLWQGITDVPLNEKGREQAKKLANSLERVDAIYSSPLKRSLETAEEIARRFEKEIIVEEDLRECEISLWNGLTVEEAIREYPVEFKKWSSDPNFGMEGLESMRNVQNRVVKAIMKIVSQEKLNGSENVVIVSHSLSLRAFICWVLGLPLYLHRNFKLDNASLSVVEIESKPRLVLLNDTCHLKGS